MEIDCIGLNCSECCKRYWITILPEEATRLASTLGLSEKEFLKKHCVLLTYFYKRKSSSPHLTVNNSILPKKISDFLEKEEFISPYYFILPTIALARNYAGECVFLKGGKCKVHESAPRPCKLFPFLASSNKPLKEHYPFCKALQQKGFENLFGKIDSCHSKKTSDYFDSIKEKGFAFVWTDLPKKGIVLIESDKELEISKKEFLELLELIQ